MLVENAVPSLTIGIPSDRDITWTEKVLSRLEPSSGQVNVLIARWVEKPIKASDVDLFNKYFPAQVVVSPARNAPAMRNAIIRETTSSHVLFLDDDMVPENDLLKQALRLSQTEPNIVHQGPPYYVANSHNWLARTEGKLYERGFRQYIGEDGNVSLLDARIMLAPVEILRESPFDESLVYGGGEGRQLALDLSKKGVPMKLSPELKGGHLNRDTISSLFAQKRAHGRGRGYQLVQNGPGNEGWVHYVSKYMNRHLKEPFGDWTRGEIDAKELIYVLGTNAVFWGGVVEQIVRSNR